MDAQEIKQLKELQDAYLSVYEAKKVDQDEDFELWVNDLIGEGYDLSDYTWDEMYESYLDEATRMRKELGKEGETAIRQELARRSRAYQRSGSVDRTIAAAEREADRTTARNRDETSDDYKDRMQKRSKTLRGLAANRRGSVRSGEGLRGYAANVSGGDRDLQSARGSARSAGTLTPKEKKQLGEEFEIIVNALVEEGYDLSSYTWNEMYDICLNGIQQLDEISPKVIARTHLKRMENLDDAEAEELGAFADGAPMGKLSRLSAKTSDAAAKVRRHRALSTAHARSRKRMKDAGQNVQDSYEYDIFDAILEHLIAEGYANTNESALVIMANMSEGWRQSIVDSSI
jgi:hypothetical protein